MQENRWLYSTELESSTHDEKVVSCSLFCCEFRIEHLISDVV